MGEVLFSLLIDVDSDAFTPPPLPLPERRLNVYRQLGGPAAIERHTGALRVALYEQLSALRHSNGAPLLNIFGRHHWPNRCGGHGGLADLCDVTLDERGKAPSDRARASRPHHTP